VAARRFISIACTRSLAIVMHYTASRSARQLYQKLVAVAVAVRCWVRLLTRATLQGLQAELPSWSAWPKRCTATQPYNHTATDLVSAAIDYC
jgi:hypothetical protein